MINKLYFIILFFISSQCFGEWQIVQPIRNTHHSNKYVNDIEGQLTSKMSSIYREPSDLVGWTHEGCHGVAARLRQIKGNGYNAVYVLNNKVFFVKEPRIKLSDIANKVQSKHRGGVYNLYLVSQQQYWNNEPCYILDENAAYICGSICGLRLGVNTRSQHSAAKMLETLIYSIYLDRLAKQDDIHYIVNWQVGRCKKIYEAFPRKSNDMIKQYNNLIEILNAN